MMETHRVKFNQNEVNPVYQLWKEDDGTLQHFISDCKYMHMFIVSTLY